MAERIWITWEKHRRTCELASQIPGLTLFLLEYRGHRLSRYSVLLTKTIRILRHNRPRLVIVQNPSIILTAFVILCSKLMQFSVVVDAHNEGLRPFHRYQNWLLPLYNFLQSHAALTIVTNQNLANAVALNRGRPFVLEDKIPDLSPKRSLQLQGKHNIVYICTYEKDEPFREVIQAARILDPAIFVYITGPKEKAPASVFKDPPDNLFFCDFLPEEDYINLLHSCDAVLDLTRMEDCLVCGAYEAVALAKPLILSNTSASRSYFSNGTVYTDNMPEAIARAVARALDQQTALHKEAQSLRNKLRTDWEQKKTQFLFALNRIETR